MGFNRTFFYIKYKYLRADIFITQYYALLPLLSRGKFAFNVSALNHFNCVRHYTAREEGGKRGSLGEVRVHDYIARLFLSSDTRMRARKVTGLKIETDARIIHVVTFQRRPCYVHITGAVRRFFSLSLSSPSKPNISRCTSLFRRQWSLLRKLVEPSFIMLKKYIYIEIDYYAGSRLSFSELHLLRIPILSHQALSRYLTLIIEKTF